MSSVGLVGTPWRGVDVEDIMKLRQLQFKWSKIVAILRISRATLCRRLEEAGNSTSDETNISDQELDDVISYIK